MANPQAEDGHVDLANEIIEALAKIRISGEEMQCLWVIFRKTYGWHKKEDMIALSQFSKSTGLKKTQVLRAIRKLQYKRIIVIKKDNDIANTYLFNKDFDDWKPLPKKIMNFIRESSLKKFCYLCGFKDAIEEHHITPRSENGSDRVENKIIVCPNCHASIHKGKYQKEYLLTKKSEIELGVIKNDNPISIEALSKKGHTKETIQKKTIQKKIYSSFFLSFWEKYPKKVGKPNALKEWNRIKPEIETVLSALQAQIENKENLIAENKFCPEWPDPERWIKNQRWLDEINEGPIEDRRMWDIEHAERKKNEST